ncbi:hypothetical protein B0F90DRAFT_1631877, partial [Multifurca ochricompacta]
SRQLGLLWRWDRITYTRILFIFARYPALTCAVVDLLPTTVKLGNVTTCLRLITIIFSELILATRTWAIWEKSRPILLFLVILAIACTTTAIVIIERDIVTTTGMCFELVLQVLLAPSAIPSIQGVQQCQTLTSAVKHAWVVPYLVTMLFEAVVLGLTLYKVLQYYKNIPIQSRSRLLDVLWIDGVIYFVFMLLLGILNIGLVLQVSTPQLRGGGTQLQTVLHSVLSTRIVLHIAATSKQDLVDSRSTLAQHRFSTRMEFADVSEVTAEGEANVHVELEELERL